MKIKLFLMVAVQIFTSPSFFISASDSNVDDDHSETSTEVIEYEEKDVAISSEVTYRLIQMFTHEAHHYKNVEYGNFYENYKTEALNIVALVLDKSELSEDELYNSDTYTIVGEGQMWDDEPLFDCLKARNTLIVRINKFIDNHEADVRSKCIGDGLQETTSRVVWAPGCCDLQLHKSCFQQCKKNNMRKCVTGLPQQDTNM